MSFGERTYFMDKNTTRERTLDTFAAHRTKQQGYGSVADTIMNFALKTEYDIDAVRKEKKQREML